MIAKLLCLLLASASIASAQSAGLGDRSVVSTANSSTVPLAGLAEFVGQAEDVSQVADISIFAYSDVASSSDGLKIEWSTDGTNFDEDDRFTITATSATRIFTFGVISKYARVRYKNGAAAQGAFRLQTIYHSGPVKPSSHRISQSISEESDAEVVKAVIAAKDTDSGNFGNVQMDNGRMLVDISGIVAESAFYSADSGLTNAAVGNADNAILLIVNLSTSTKKLKLYSRFMGVDVGNVIVGYRLYLDPVVTSSGTPKAIIAIRQGSVASAMQAYTLPTVSSFGSLIDSQWAGQNTAPVQIFDNQSIWLEPGHTLLFAANPGSNNRTVDISVKWVEE